MPGRRDLIKEFRDEEYRNAYVEEFLDSALAAQIKALRDARNLTQAQLAKLIGTKQSGVSKYENVNYSKWNISTLKSIAKALEVVLSVKFVSFGEALAEIEGFSKRALIKPTFEQDPTFLNVEIRVPVVAAAPAIPPSITANTTLTSQSKARLSTPTHRYHAQIRPMGKSMAYTYESTPFSQSTGV